MHFLPGRVMIFIAVSCIVVFSQCNKNDGGPAPVTPKKFDETELSKNFYFKPGSYWIYKDSLTGRLDSIYVTANDTGQWDDNFQYAGVGRPCVLTKMLQQNIDNSNLYDTARWQFYLTGDNAIMDYFHGTKDITKEDIKEFRYNQLFINPMQATPKEWLWINYHGDAVAAYLHPSNYIINGNSYDSVFEYTHISVDTNKNNYQVGYGAYKYINDDFFIKKRIGIVKMRLEHPLFSPLHYVWELQRYHLVF